MVGGYKSKRAAEKARRKLIKQGWEADYIGVRSAKLGGKHRWLVEEF